MKKNFLLAIIGITVSINSHAQTLLWHHLFSQDSMESPRAIAHDLQNNVIAYVQSFNYNQNQAVIKYDSAGNLLWTHEFAEGNFGLNYGGLQTTNDGSIYYLRTTVVPYFTIRGALTKLDAGGNEQWTVNSGDSINGCFFNNFTFHNGSIYIAAYAVDTNFDYHAVLLKCDDSGNITWQKQYNIGADSLALGYTLSFNHAGHLILSGNCETTGVPFLQKCDTDGNVLWLYEYPALGTLFIAGIDASDNIFLAGNGNTLNVGQYCKIDSAGSLLWQKEGGIYNNLLRGQLDEDENLVIYGDTTISYNQHTYLARIDQQNGDIMWSTVGADAATASAPWGDMKVKGDGVYTCGFDLTNGHGQVSKYKLADGGLSWSSTYNHFESNLNVDLDESGNVLVLGMEGVFGEYGAYIFKYSDNNVGIEQPNDYSTINIFPNPATDYFQIQYPATTDALLSLIDMEGKICMRQKLEASSDSSPVAVNIESLETGYYLVRIESQNEVIVRPLMITK